MEKKKEIGKTMRKTEMLMFLREKEKTCEKRTKDGKE